MCKKLYYLMQMLSVADLSIPLDNRPLEPFLCEEMKEPVIRRMCFGQ
jgi:hypothetical protein